MLYLVSFNKNINVVKLKDFKETQLSEAQLEKQHIIRDINSESEIQTVQLWQTKKPVRSIRIAQRDELSTGIDYRESRMFDIRKSGKQIK